MADFRRWLLAFAVLAVVCSLAVPASAQTIAPPLTCFATTNNSPAVRSEGYTELMGDMVFQCTGGTPTPAGQQVPQVNITLFLSTAVTSRILGTVGAVKSNEALILIDEPHSGQNPARPILACGDTGAPESPANTDQCTIYSNGNPAMTYDGTANSAGAGNPSNARPNVFQGLYTGQANTITWLGVPIDPPGTTTSRIIRITNVRGNVTTLQSSTFAPAQVTASLSISPPSSLPINAQFQPVGVVLKGLSFSMGSATGTQCNSGSKTVTAKYLEGFFSAFKPKNLRQVIDNNINGVNGPFYRWSGTKVYNTVDLNQNVPGTVYNTESGFEYNVNNADPTKNAPPGIGQPVTATTNPLNNGYGVGGAGIAETGTRLVLNLASVPNGVSVSVPYSVNLISALSGATTGIAVLVPNADANGAGGLPAVSSSGNYAVPLLANSAQLIYEVIFSDPNSPEEMDVPVTFSWVSNLAANLPQPGVTATGVGNFAPFYTVSAAGQPSGFYPSVYPIPRFTPDQSAANVFTIVKCSCNILFPYMTNIPPFDTGISIANTSKDIYGTANQMGTVSLNFFATPGGTLTTMTSSGNVPAGEVLLYTLSGGGVRSGAPDSGLPAFPGSFTGYMIAQTGFQYCHAFAFISDLGAQKVAEGYLGLILDDATLNATRSGQAGEVRSH